jgi:hypothetical protein
MTMRTASGAIQKATYRDRAAFVASRRAIRTRQATAEEKAAAGLPANADAAALLIKLCKGVIKIVVKRRTLAEDVTEAADAISKADGRPFVEVFDAAQYFPLIPASDLADLAHWLMADRPGCARCRCSAGYAPLATALALAAAEANLKPWATSGLREHFLKIKSASPIPITTSAPGVKAIADAIRTIIRAASYAEPQTEP